MTAHELRAYARTWHGSELRLATTAAWLGANWSRAKRMPNLSSVLDRIDKADRQGRHKKPSEWTQKDLDDADARLVQAAMVMAVKGRPAASDGQAEE